MLDSLKKRIQEVFFPPPPAEGEEGEAAGGCAWGRDTGNAQRVHAHKGRGGAPSVGEEGAVQRQGGLHGSFTQALHNLQLHL